MHFIALLGQTHFVELFHLLMELHHGLQRGVLVGDAGAVGGGAQAALLVPGVPRHQAVSHPLYVAPQRADTGANKQQHQQPEGALALWMSC